MAVYFSNITREAALYGHYRHDSDAVRAELQAPGEAYVCLSPNHIMLSR